MGKRIYDNDFEEFLKDQSSQYRMYPSDHVWRNINKEIHGYSKWPALTIIAIFIITALVVGTVVTNPHAQLTENLASKEIIAAKSAKPSYKQPTLENHKSIPVSNMSIEKITQETIDIAKETVQRNSVRDLLVINSTDPVVVNQSIVTPINIENTPGVDQNEQQKDDAPQVKENYQSSLASAIASYNIMRELQNSNTDFPNSHFKNHYQFFGSEKSSVASDVYAVQFNFELQQPEKNNSIGSRISKIGNRTNRVDFQFYITPSVSYRRLVDNAEGTLSKSYISALPYAANYVVDVGQVINHKPSTGLEVGFNLGYNLNKKLAVRSGFQFNMQQYKIDAFVRSFEPATIALSDGSSNVIFNTVSGFGSVSGSEPIELTNRYYQVSIPIIMDWRPITRGKFSWGIAAAVQPTYTFDKEPFIITSNYKNYTDGSQLMRNWNINTNIETYVGYTAGKYRWQLGPQFRYQLMPTMANNYPIKEYLLDYGLKLGLVRTLK